MAFNKRAWKGRQGVGLNKFSINGATPVTVVNQPDSITEVGDALSAGNLNDLENRIESAFNDVDTNIDTETTARETADTELKNALEAFEDDITDTVYPINLFDGDCDEGFIDYYGVYTAYSTYHASKLKLYKTGSYLFKKVAGLSISTNGIVFKYTSDGTFVDRITGTDLGDNLYKITISSDAYLRFNIGTNPVSTYMIVMGSTASDYPSSYQPYFTPFLRLTDGLHGNDILVDKGIIEPINLFDGQYDDGYYDYYGTFTSDASYCATKSQFLKKGTYLFKQPIGLGVSLKTRVFIFKDDGTFKEGISGTDLGSGIASVTFLTDVYARFNIGNGIVPYYFMIVRGSALSDYPSSLQYYFPPYLGLEEDLSINEKIKDIIPNFNKLYKKSITLNGDSICYGAGSWGGYGAIIAKRNSMPYQNIAVSGATIASETYSGSTPRHWICRTISNMNESADYAIVEGGVNDASRAVPLGSLSSGYNAVLDDTTYYGAFESMLKQLTIRFAGKKIGYILVPQMVTGMRPNQTYYNATIDCLKKWCVPYLDMSYLVPPFIDFASDGDADLYAMRQLYTYNGDGTHPTKEGYEKYYVDKIQDWLLSL